MQNQDTWTQMTAAALGLQRRLGLGQLKRAIFAMLVGWLAYFLVISMMVRTLNKVVVPVVAMPLGLFLAIQGTAVVFFIALALLARRSSTDRRLTAGGRPQASAGSR